MAFLVTHIIMNIMNHNLKSAHNPLKHVLEEFYFRWLENNIIEKEKAR